MPTLTVYQPPNNLMVPLNQPFMVTGQATDRGFPEPALIDSVTVQVDNGPLIHATLTRGANKTETFVVFKALAEVTGGQDPHTVAVTATDDSGISIKQFRQVFTGPVFQIDSPAVVIDLFCPFLNVNDPKAVARLNSLVSCIQNALVPFSMSLSSIGKILAGPNLLPATDSKGRSVLRMGLWIEDSGFPVVAASPPDFPLPRLSDEAAAAGFATVPVQLAPDLSAPAPPGLVGPTFALFIPVATLQHLVDAVAPTIKSAASQNHVSVESIPVRTSSPASVVTSFVGDLPLSVGFTVTITETLGLVPVPNADPPQMVPAVIGSSDSSSVGSILDWFVGFLFPLFGLALLGALGVVSSAAGKIAGKINGVAAPLIAGIPTRIPFQNTMLPCVPPEILPDFPTLVPNWTFFGANSSGILGTATTAIEPRTQSTASLSISGPGFLEGYQEDLAGGAAMTYNFTLVDLIPDTDKFTWQVSGTHSSGGAISLGTLAQSGSFNAYFGLPLRVAPGTYPFTLAATGTETCASDPSKTLTGSASTAVRLEVRPNPKIPP